MMQVHDEDHGDLQPPVLIDDQCCGTDEHPEMHFSHTMHLVDVLSGKDCADRTQNVLIQSGASEQLLRNEVCRYTQRSNTESHEPGIIKECDEDAKQEHDA